MKISDGEKIILLMLSEIYKKIGIKDGEIDPEFIKSVIFNDQIWGLSWKYTGIPFEDTKTPEIVNEVVNILDMWSFIEDSYEELSAKDKNKLSKDVEPFGNNPKFHGFDGNHETEYLSVARFIVKDLDRYERFEGRDLNSHFPSIYPYRRMLSVFEPIRKNLELRSLSLNELTLILKEMIHPINRK